MCIIVLNFEPLGKGWMREWWTWMSCAVGGALLVLVTVVVISLTLPKNSANKKTLQPQYPFVIPDNVTVEDKQLIIENGYRFIDRTQWAARPEKLSSLLKLPVHKVIITHSATDACFTRLECVNVVKAIQDFHMDGNKWDDIGYNFLVSGDGDIYIGRGWDKLGSHTKGYNVESVCVTFIGTFTNQLPTLEQVNTAKLLIKIGVILGKIDKDYELYGHRQLISTDSPGAGVYNIIKTWPHWIDTSKKSNDTEITNI